MAEGELLRWLTYHRLWLYPSDPNGPYDPTSSDFEEPVDGRTVRLRKYDPDDLVLIEPLRGTT